jgi:EGF-like domain
VDVPIGDLNHDGRVSIDTYVKTQFSRYLLPEIWPAAVGTYSFVNNIPSLGIDPSSFIGGDGYALGPDEAHFSSFCSNRGTCDTSSGVCKCDPGYSGGACQRAVCPNSCSGHGVCKSIEQVASSALSRHFVASNDGVNIYSGLASPFHYSLWDADSLFQCICDPGFTGPDCSLRTCPFGFDPLISSLPRACNNAACNQESQIFGFDAGQGNVSYRLMFTTLMGQTYTTNDFMVITSVDLSSDSVSNLIVKKNIEAALESLPNNATGLVNVSVSGGGPSSSSPRVTIRVTFLQHSGNLPEMQALLGTGLSGFSSGTPAVLQPSFGVQTFRLSGVLTSTTVQVRLHPLDLKHVRVDPSISSLTDPTLSLSAVAIGGTASSSDVSTALKTAISSIPSLSYDFPDIATSLYVSCLSTTPATFTCTVALPNRQWGANPMTLTVSTPATVSQTPYTLSIDGNSDSTECSDRGMCDRSSGLCVCFNGYSGASCDRQSV